MNRTTFYGLIFVCVLPLCGAIAYAQTCGSSTQLNWTATETRDATGVYHISVNYSGGINGTPNATMKAQLEGAIADWNGLYVYYRSSL